MAFLEYANYDGLGLGELVRKGEVTASELMDEAIARAEKHNPKINAIVYKFYEEACKTACRKSGNGPFEGVPFLLKDILGDCQGVPTRFASRYFPNFPSPVDCELVARYKRAGLIPFAKTNAPEFGLPPITEPQLYGPCRNPWNTDYTPGGSSGGSAAAVAARIVPLAHGNDGGGSIRIPSACCGLVGLKPTRGRNSFAPNLGDVMGGLVNEHVLTRSVRDSAAALDATEGYVPGDPYCAPPKKNPYLQEVTTSPGRLKIAFSQMSPYGETLHEEAIKAVKDAAKLCADLSHEVTEATPTLNTDQIAFAFITIYAAGLASTIEAIQQVTHVPPTSDILESLTLNFYELGKKVTGAQYLIAIATLQSLSRQMAAFFETYDVLVTPAIGCPPLKVGTIDFKSPSASLLDRAIATFAHINPYYNVSGQPAISLPLHWTAEGLPLGVLFGTKYGDEATLFRLAGQIEQAKPWKDKHPTICG